MHAIARLAQALLLTYATVCAHAQNITALQTLAHPSRPLCKPVADCLVLLNKGEECPILPVPARARLQPVPSGTYRLTNVRSGVWVYDDGAYLTLILRLGTRLALIDFPESGGSDKSDGSGTRVTDAAEQIMNGTIPSRVDMVYSHSHLDHIGAATRFYNYMKATYSRAHFFIWASEAARDHLARTVTGRAVPPTVIVGEPGRTLTLGTGLSVRMQVVGGHAGGDLLFYIPKFQSEPSVIMVVDIVFPRWAPFVAFALSEDLRGYIETHEQILEFDFDIYVGGHFRVGSRKDVRESLRLANDIVKSAAEGIKTSTGADFAAAGIGKVSDPAAPEFGNLWYAFVDVVRKVQAELCYRTVLEKWGCKVGGLDRTLRSHCFWAVEYVLIDM